MCVLNKQIDALKCLLIEVIRTLCELLNEPRLNAHVVLGVNEDGLGIMHAQALHDMAERPGEKAAEAEGEVSAMKNGKDTR